MLTLWYIILGWKEYNKPFRKAEQPPEPEDVTKKLDLIPQKKDVIPTQPKDINRPDPPVSIDSNPPAPSEPFAFNKKTPEKPKIPSPVPADPPKAPETPKMPELPKVTPETPEMPKVPFNTPQYPKSSDHKSNSKAFEEKPVKPVEPKKRASDRLKDFKLEPDEPKKPEVPDVTPSRSPKSDVPDVPASTKNPAPVSPLTQPEFPLRPSVPWSPKNREDELFAMGSQPQTLPSKTIGNLRNLSYAEGEDPGKGVADGFQKGMFKEVKPMDQSVISSLRSFESDEEDEDF